MANDARDRRRLDVRKKLAHIDQMLADHDQEHQEIRLATWGLIILMATIMAAFFMAGAVFVKVFG